MCEIVMLIFGIIALIKGRFLLTRAKEVRGWPARIIGILLIAPWPLSLMMATLLGVVFLAMGKRVDIGDKEFVTAAQITGFAVVLVCLVAAIAVAMIFAQPIRKSRPEPVEEVIPDDYDERFRGKPRKDSESQGIMEEPSHPAPPPDDRIQQ